jgi:hypothetical protein
MLTMHRHRLFAATLLIAFSAGIAVAQASPSFTISATNITMSTSDASIPFTLTSIDGYAGSVTVGCKPPNVSAGVYLPYCGLGGAAGSGSTVTLKANATVSGDMSLHTQPYPAAARLHLPGYAADAAWAFAGVFLLAFGSGRRRIRRLSILLLSVGIMAGLTWLTGCGGNNPNDLTPGTYIYTLNAVDANNLTVSTTVKVTILSGIPR